MKPYIIGIAGGTGSGKSTLSQRIKNIFGDQVTIMYHDMYYRRHDEIPFEERVHINYDHPDALETDLLVKHLQDLKAGKSIECPVYDFTQHNRSNDITVIQPTKVIILEGILIFQNPELAQLCDMKIYVEADADERILRRALRDMKERGRTLDNIIQQYLTTVKPMHYAYVAPTKKLADLIINTAYNDVALDALQLKIKEILTKEEEK